MSARNSDGQELVGTSNLAIIAEAVQKMKAPFQHYAEWKHLQGIGWEMIVLLHWHYYGTQIRKQDCSPAIEWNILLWSTCTVLQLWRSTLDTPWGGLPGLLHPSHPCQLLCLPPSPWNPEILDPPLILCAGTVWAHVQYMGQLVMVQSGKHVWNRRMRKWQINYNWLSQWSGLWYGPAHKVNGSYMYMQWGGRVEVQVGEGGWKGGCLRKARRSSTSTSCHLEMLLLSACHLYWRHMRSLQIFSL